LSDLDAGVLSRTATGLAAGCQIDIAAAPNGGSPMAEGHELLRDDEWRIALAANFNGLIQTGRGTWPVPRAGSARLS
jgi:hypothetical protein